VLTPLPVGQAYRVTGRLRLGDQEDRFRLHLALKILSLRDKVSRGGAGAAAYRTPSAS